MKSKKELLFAVRITYLTAVLRVYSHQTLALMLASVHTLMLGRNTLFSVVTFTPHISVRINTDIEIQMSWDGSKKREL